MHATLEHSSPLNSRQFLIAVKRLADSLSYGTDQSPFLGQGIEYVQSRLYEPGDPVKSIDWKVTAKMAKTYVKEYELPKSLPVWVVLDTSASMALSSMALSKYGLAVQIAGGLALACLDRVSPVGLLGAGERNIVIKPSLSRDRVMQWMHQLRFHRMSESTKLGDKLRSLNASLKTRALVIVLSDFHDPSALRSLKLLAANHDVAAIRFEDPAEYGSQGAGFLYASEAETGRRFLAKGRFGADDGFSEDLRKAAIDNLLIRTDEPVAQKLRHFFKNRTAFTGKG